MFQEIHPRKINCRGLRSCEDFSLQARHGSYEVRFPRKKGRARWHHPSDHIARLVEKKGLEYSIKAVADLVGQFPKLEYTIVGDGYLRQDLSLLIERLNLQKNVKLVGWKTQEEIRRFFAKSHIFVLASVLSSDGDFEVRAWCSRGAAMGLPVVCTNHNGFSESIIDGQSGFLVPERDADAFRQS